MDMGEKIKKRREELGLTLQEVGNYIGVSKATVQRYESGEIKNLKIETIEKLCKILKVTPAYLMGWESPENPNDEEFKSPEAAMKFILEQPALAAFGGYDLSKMSNEEIIEFANELLRQLKLLGYKYKK